jgi:hypothetical protein
VFILSACSKTDLTVSTSLDSHALNSPNTEIAEAGLPALSQLKQSSAMLAGMDGSAYSYSHNAVQDGTSAVLEYAGALVPGSQLPDYTYAIYLFNDIQSLPPILAVETEGENTSRLYVAVANWRTGRWDFGFGHVYSYSTHSFPLPELEQQPGDFISGDKTLAVAFVKVDNDGPARINKLNFWEPEEIIDVQATEGLWEGITVSWEGAPNTDLVNIERRAQGVPVWEQVLTVPIAANLLQYSDTVAEGGIYYEYRVSGGFRWDTVLGPKYYWTTGKKAIGLRSVDTVEIGMNNAEYLMPGNSFNRLSFYFAPNNDPNGVHAIRNTSFPPGQDWELFDETSTNFPYLNVADHPDFGREINIFHLNELNNPLVNITYSDETGCYAYAALLDSEGHYEWLNPGIVRTGNNHVLGVMALERRLACFTWNDDTQQIEFVDSIDNEGTFWNVYNQTGIFSVVSTKKPLGRVTISQTLRQSLSFREKATNDVVICMKSNTGWDEESVGIVTSATPVLQNVKLNQLDNTRVVIYLNDDRSRIKIVRHFEGAGWLTNQQETPVLVKDEDTINEFIHYMLEPPSNFNILAYTVNGKLYFKFSSKAGQDVWSKEILLDDSGSCRNLNITRIGTDLEWAYFTFLSYLRTDDLGNSQLKFVDLNSILEAEDLI